MSRICPHDNLFHGEFVHMKIFHVDKFLHMTDFFPMGTTAVVPMTNIRYASVLRKGGLGGRAHADWQPWSFQEVDTNPPPAAAADIYPPPPLSTILHMSDSEGSHSLPKRLSFVVSAPPPPPLFARYIFSLQYGPYMCCFF